MKTSTPPRARTWLHRFYVKWGALVLAGALLPQLAQAIPLFARQTGQNCVACHAGGQFPELTPYGRMFKMTGYTMGERTSVPLSAMVVATMSQVANTSKSDSPSTDFAKNGQPILATASLFTGGKISDNVGAFVQVTYDPYATQNSDGSFSSQTNMDNVDVRFADRFVGAGSDWIFGASLNNNPSVSDPWNTSAAWMQYVPVPSPTSSQFVDGASPYPGYGAGSNVAGLTAYGFWNQTLYGEVGAYRTADHLFHILGAGVPGSGLPQLKGFNPYWRLAYNHQWGAHSMMVGVSGMDSEVYDNSLDTSDPTTTHHYRDLIVDAQYQYILDPHTFTAQFVYDHQRHVYPDSVVSQGVSFVDAAGNPLAAPNNIDTTNLMRAKFSYVYQAKYGGSLSLFSLRGSTNTLSQTSGYAPDLLPPAISSDPNLTQYPSTRVNGNLSGNPATQGQTYEIFMMPIQNIRVGLQYTNYNLFNGAKTNYDGFGRNASDNNTLFVYAWAAF